MNMFSGLWQNCCLLNLLLLTAGANPTIQSGEKSCYGVPYSDQNENKVTDQEVSSRDTIIHRRDPDTIIRLPQYSHIHYEVPENFKKSAKILFWSQMYSNREHWFWYFTKEAMKDVCPDVQCEFTIDNSQLNSSDAVMFMVYRDDFKFEENLQSLIPPYRLPNQRYVFYLTEPPDTYPYRNMSQLNGFFNWTATYRRDSDVMANYGKIILNKIPHREQELQSISRDYTVGKSKLAVWIVSHCSTEGKREDYIRELQKYIAIDVYGECGSLKCQPPRSEECYQNITSQYKFYLSFENIICKDYVTEKFMRPLNYDIVPIGFGGADYSQYAPEGSFIDALKFPNPKELAEYLLKLDKNNEEYNRFFDWKRGYTSKILVDPLTICDLCIKLLDPTEPMKIYNDLDKWWNQDGNCQRWISSNTIEKI